MPNANATYVYCIVHSEQPPGELVGSEGLPHTGSLRVLSIEKSLWLVVSDAPLKHYSGEAIEARLNDLEWVGACAMAHERVVESFLDAEALVPLKLFTLFSSDARALQGMREKLLSLKRAVARVKGCEEWGIRVLYDPQKARQAAVQATTESSPASGAAFLQRKKMIRDAAASGLQDGAQWCAKLYASFSKRAKLSCQRQLQTASGGGQALLDAAFLIPKEASSGFARAAQEAAEDGENLALRVRVTGPWPAYSFLEV